MAGVSVAARVSSISLTKSMLPGSSKLLAVVGLNKASLENNVCKVSN